MLVAHGGGAPEALTVILPIAIFTAFMYVERRNRRRQAPAAEPPPEPEVGDEPSAQGSA